MANLTWGAVGLARHGCQGAVVRLKGVQGRPWGPGGDREQWGSGGQGLGPMVAHPVCCPGSPFRDEITLAILQLQENNRLEILKRKWWEGSRCPKEEDRRAKGQPPACVPPGRSFTARCPHSSTPGSSLTPRSGHGEHWRHFCCAYLWPHHCCLRGRHGVYMVHAEVSRVRRGEEVGEGCQVAVGPRGGGA